MEKEKSNSGLIVLVILLIVCVLGLAGYIVYDKINETSTSNLSKTTTTNVVKDKEKSDVETKDNIANQDIEPSKLIELTKEYYIQNNYYKEQEVEWLEVSSIRYLGYTTENKYYVLSGNYRCNDLSSNCVYNEQTELVDDNNIYLFKTIIVLNNDNKIEKLDSVASENLAKNNLLGDDFNYINQYIYFTNKYNVDVQ